MKMGKDGWMTLDVRSADDMLPEIAAQYEAYKASYKVMQAARQAYEQAMTEQYAPTGKALVFGYMYGNASIKFVDASEKAQRKASKPTQSLADYLASASGNGHAA